ncbi:MAG: pseudouridine synthase [Edaphocola sp.]
MLLHYFNRAVAAAEQPTLFTFPFYYRPHPLCMEAATELWHYLEQNDLNHNFGLNGDTNEAIGKMFGVLLVQDRDENVAALWAFSGKLGNTNNVPGFVPPIFDMLDPKGHYKQQENELNDLNKSIWALQQAPHYLGLLSQIGILENESRQTISHIQQQNRIRKAQRNAQRKEHADTDPKGYNQLAEALVRQSHHDQYVLKKTKEEYAAKLQTLYSEKEATDARIETLKQKRKEQSGALQQYLFEQYDFYNARSEKINVVALFANTDQKIPPAGTGECATPKLLQYAYQHGLTPLAMAEFWWGISPKSQVRKHKHFYPACRSKCEPVLNFMLQGLAVAPNPMLQQQTVIDTLPVIYEDDYLLAINKPAELLSVPGKNGFASVYEIIKNKYPHATGPLLVHRLDMSTSGILLIAKNKEVHQHLQAQFIKKTVTKRYTAILEKIPDSREGIIDLPLRVDLDNRPHQVVCHEHGKPAITKYEIVATKDGCARVRFYPLTGRTHQLRLHAAHQNGLNAPIMGDDLYGTPKDRLYLHADMLTFKHPVSKAIIEIDCPAPF